MADGDFFDGLYQLVEEWYERAETPPVEGDDALMLFLMRVESGDVELRLMSAKDWLSTISVDDIMYAGDRALNRRSRPRRGPVVTRTIKKKE